MAFPAIIPFIWQAAASMVGRIAARAAAAYVVRSVFMRLAIRRAATQVAVQAASPTTQLPLALSGGVARTRVVERITLLLARMYNALGRSTVKVTLGAIASTIVLRFLLGRAEQEERRDEERGYALAGSADDKVTEELLRLEVLLQTHPMASTESEEQYADRLVSISMGEATPYTAAPSSTAWR